MHTHTVTEDNSAKLALMPNNTVLYNTIMKCSVNAIAESYKHDQNSWHNTRYQHQILTKPCTKSRTCMVKRIVLTTKFRFAHSCTSTCCSSQHHSMHYRLCGVVLQRKTSVPRHCDTTWSVECFQLVQVAADCTHYLWTN